MKDVEQNIQNEVIKEEIFLKPKEIRNTFEKISLLLTARFTDNTKSQSITYQLNELKETYSLLILYADDFEHELSDTIRIYYLSFPNNKCELFTYQYQLPFPSQEKVMLLKMKYLSTRSQVLNFHHYRYYLLKRIKKIKMSFPVVLIQ